MRILLIAHRSFLLLIISASLTSKTSPFSMLWQWEEQEPVRRIGKTGDSYWPKGYFISQNIMLSLHDLGDHPEEGLIAVWGWVWHQSVSGEQLRCASLVFLEFLSLSSFYYYFYCILLCFSCCSVLISTHEFYFFPLILPHPLEWGGGGQVAGGAWLLPGVKPQHLIILPEWKRLPNSNIPLKDTKAVLMTHLANTATTAN